MAKLGSYFGLCPLIDQKSLLGISEDAEPGLVIVTLGKNIAMKYKLYDQKQILSWTTKEKFTSPVIYNADEEKYVAVFNQMYIRIWDEDVEHLDKVKKLKFNTKIHTLFSYFDQNFIVFQNGAMFTLKNALENRKELNTEGVMEEDEELKDILYTEFNQEFYIGLLLISKTEGHYMVWTKFDSSGNKTDFTRLRINRDDNNLSGYAFHSDEIGVNLLTIWSDAKMYIEPLSRKSIAPELCSVIETLSTKDTVSIISLDKNYIALYGAASNEEGALLIIYNIQFKVVQSKQSFKMFTEGARLWSIQNNLLLPVGQNLAVVPFVLETEQLSALVGSHKITEKDEDLEIIQEEVQVANWENISKAKVRKIMPDSIWPKVESLKKQGLPEGLILEQLIPEYIENNKLPELRDCVNNFCDIPECCLVQLLKYFLTVSKDFFSDKMKMKSDDYPIQLQPYDRFKVLCKVLNKPFSDVLLLPILRSELPLDEVITLLNLIYFLLIEENVGADTPEVEMNLINWICVIFDANYQKILVAKDESLISCIIKLSSFVSLELESIKSLQENVTCLREVCKGKCGSGKIACKSNYAIEKLNLLK